MRQLLLLALCLTTACARPAPAPPAPVAAAAPDTGFTKRLEFALLEDYDKGDSLARLTRDFRLMRELGIDVWRGSFGWDDYEPERGAYDFAWLHDFASVARAEGITLRPYLGYTPEWAAAGRRDDGQLWNDPPRDLAEWERFVDTLARAMRVHPNVASYEIYNEVNVPLWWDGTVEEYAAVLERGARAVQRAAPGTPVLMAGLVWPDVDWTRRSCELVGDTALVDVVAFHAYPETWTPDSVTLERYLGAPLDEYVPAVQAACGAEVWMNEGGFATTAGETEEEQAAWWVRAAATLAAAPGVTHVGVYELRDLPLGEDVIGDPENHHLGLIDVDGSKKLAFHTVQRLVDLLGGELTVRDGALGLTTEGAGRPEAHLFRRADGRHVLIAWVPPGTPPATVTFTLPEAPARATAYALDGTAHRAPPIEGRTIPRVVLRPGEPRMLVLE